MLIRLKFIFICILSLFLLTSGGLAATSTDPCSFSFKSRAEISIEALEKYKVPTESADILAEAERFRLRTTLKTIFPEYGQQRRNVVATKIEKLLQKHLKNRPEELRIEDYLTLNLGNDEVKYSVEYMFYVDQFANGKGNGTFKDVQEMLDYFEELGAQTIYPLPFLKSPFKDGGFDVSDFRSVAQRFGGDEAFASFLKEAKKRGMKVKMDMILNHVSEEHTWFQKFLSGDMRYKDYFVVRDSPPDIVQRYTNDQGSFVRYREVDANGEIIEVDRRLIFPDIADTHYRKVNVKLQDGSNQDFWVYHTFFPYQLDLNYSNPEVLLESLDLVAYWANQGIDIFRLDAIPFLDKMAENHERTHKIIEVMQSFLKQLSPKSAFMVEANQPPKLMLEYLGKNMSNHHTALNSPMDMTTEAMMGYNFGEVPFWASLLTGDKKYFENTVHTLQQLDMPEGTAWTVFTRVHDELTLEMVPPEVRKTISNELLKQKNIRGLPFREGDGEFYGVGGRVAAFLDKNPDRIEQAFAMMLGRPGKPVIYFGDELGLGNNIDYLISEAKTRMKFMVDNKIPIRPVSGESKKIYDQLGIPTESTYKGKKYPLPLDSRDGNRGPIPRELYEKARKKPKSLEGKIFNKIKRLISVRKNNPIITKGKMKILPHNNDGIIAYTLESEGEKVLVLMNLTDQATNFSHQILGNKKLKNLIDNQVLIPKQEQLKMKPFQSLWIKIP